MPLAAITFLTPSGAFIALAVALPLVASAFATARVAAVRRLLHLPPARRATAGVETVSLAAVPLLLALAAAGPALSSSVGQRTRASTEAIFVIDVSRSMAAAAGPHSPTRLAQAKAAAIELRRALPDVRVGVSSLTTELLPHLFPTSDQASFDSTVDQALAILKPPPPAFQAVATTFDPLAGLAGQGFFKPSTKHRVAVLLTDGESTVFDPKAVGAALNPPRSQPNPSGFPVQPAQPRVNLLVLRFGGAGDRIYRRNGSIDPAYSPDLRAPEFAGELARDAGGRAFTGASLAGIGAALRSLLAPGPNTAKVTAGTTTKATRLAPYVALATVVPLGLLVWRRNLVSL